MAKLLTFIGFKIFTKKTQSLIIICTLYFNFSCTDNLNDQPHFEPLLFQNEDFLSIDELIKITDDISDSKFDFENERINIDQLERNLKKSLSPLVENGRHLHVKLLNNINRNGEANKLSRIELKEIQDLTDQQLAEFSFAINYSNHNLSVDPRLKACLSSALGLVGLYDLYRNTHLLGSAQSIIKAMRLVGRRALGWIGVGLMIMDFTDCYYVL